MFNKSTWVPPDPVALRLKVMKTIYDNTNAKYFQLRLFRAYSASLNLDFKDAYMLNQNIPLSTKEHDNWIITKIYLPIASPLHVIKGAMTRHDKSGGQVAYDRVGVEIADRFAVEIDTPKVYFKSAQAQLKNNILTNLKYLMTTKDNPTKGGNAVVLLTDKNWGIVDQDPDPDNIVMYDYKNEKAEGTFECKLKEPLSAGAAVKKA